MTTVKPEVKTFLKKSAELTGEAEARQKEIDEETSLKIFKASVLLDEAKRKTIVLDQKFDELTDLLKFYVDLVDETDDMVTQTLQLLRDKLKMQKMEGKF